MPIYNKVKHPQPIKDAGFKANLYQLLLAMLLFLLYVYYVFQHYNVQLSLYDLLLIGFGHVSIQVIRHLLLKILL